MASPLQASLHATESPASVRRLIVAWQNPIEGGPIVPVGFLERTATGYRFGYLRRARTLPGFRPFLGLPDLSQRYESTVLFPLFRQRLMDRRRSDLSRYFAILGLSAQVDELDELGRSGGRRAGDTIFMVPEPQIMADGTTAADFFVHGIRHKQGAEEHILRLRLGEALHVKDEPDNPKDKRALLVTHDNTELGYIPDLLVDFVHAVRETGRLSLTVAQVNDVDTPPNLRLRVHLQGSVPSNYRPFLGPQWELA